MTNEYEVHTLAAPYVLHSLPADEIEPFELHLRGCRACHDEVDETREVAARLGFVKAIEPSNELKRRVLAAIAAVRPLPPAVDHPEVPSEASTAPNVIRRWWPRLSTAAAAALVVAVGVLASTLSDTNRQLDAAEELTTQMEQVVAAPDVKHANDASTHGRAVVLSSRSSDTAVVVPAGMDPAPDDHVYQVWLMHGDHNRSAGLLRSNAGAATEPLAVHGLGEATQIGITIEPAGGSDRPTTVPAPLLDLPA